MRTTRNSPRSRLAHQTLHGVHLAPQQVDPAALDLEPRAAVHHRPPLPQLRHRARPAGRRRPRPGRGPPRTARPRTRPGPSRCRAGPGPAPGSRPGPRPPRRRSSDSRSTTPARNSSSVPMPSAIGCSMAIESEGVSVAVDLQALEQRIVEFGPAGFLVTVGDGGAPARGVGPGHAPTGTAWRPGSGATPAPTCAARPVGHAAVAGALPAAPTACWSTARPRPHRSRRRAAVGPPHPRRAAPGGRRRRVRADLPAHRAGLNPQLGARPRRRTALGSRGPPGTATPTPGRTARASARPTGPGGRTTACS